MSFCLQEKEKILTQVAQHQTVYTLADFWGHLWAVKQNKIVCFNDWERSIYYNYSTCFLSSQPTTAEISAAVFWNIVEDLSLISLLNVKEVRWRWPGNTWAEWRGEEEKIRRKSHCQHPVMISVVVIFHLTRREMLLCSYRVYSGHSAGSYQRDTGKCHWDRRFQMGTVRRDTLMRDGRKILH